MKVPLTTVSIFLCIVCIASAEGEYDWLKDHVIVRTEEKVQCDAGGTPVKIETTQRSRIELVQTVYERREKNKKGDLVTVAKIRTSQLKDTDDCLTIIKEKSSGLDSDFEIVSIMKTLKTADGSVTTVRHRGADGELALVRRVTVSTDEEGMTTTTVETAGPDGALMLREVKTQY